MSKSMSLSAARDDLAEVIGQVRFGGELERPPIGLDRVSGFTKVENG